MYVALWDPNIPLSQNIRNGRTVIFTMFGPNILGHISSDLTMISCRCFQSIVYE